MEEQVQLFSLADLIFSRPVNNPITISSSDVKAIQMRFMSILDSFKTSDTHYTTNFIKGNSSKLPYRSEVFVGKMSEHLVLSFEVSYNKPLLFVIDTRTSKAKNFIDIEDAKKTFLMIPYTIT